MINPILLTASLMALVIAQPAIAQDKDEDDTLVLEPSSDWQLREMDDRCRLSRRFGNGEDRTTLWIDQGGPEANFNLTIIGRPVRHPLGPQTNIQFAPEPVVSRDYIKSESSRGRPVMAMFGVSFAPDQHNASLQTATAGDDEETVDLSRTAESSANQVDGININGDDSLPSQERLARVTSLRLQRAVIEPFALEIGPLNSVLPELSECATKLAFRLAAGGGEGGTRPKPIDELTWASALQRNYPRHMLRTEQEGAVAIRLTVNAKGKATNCHIRGSTRPQAFDDTVCLLSLRHAKFEPARSANGEAVAAFYSTEVVFRLN